MDKVCLKCGYPVMWSYGGWGHAPGYYGKRHVVKVAENERTDNDAGNTA